MDSTDSNLSIPSTNRTPPMPTYQIDLTGTWDFVADLDPKYHAIHGGFHNPTANRRHWQQVPVPGVWQKYGARYDIYEGVCWFAREFALAAVPANARARLRFGAVNYLATVYLNGEQVGSHEGGYTEFALDVTGKLQPGTNHLAVQVDNRALITKWPPCLGYFNYGGIHRGVSLEIADGPALADVHLEAVPAKDGWKLAVRGQVDQSDLSDGSDTLLARVSSDGLSWEEPIGPGGALAVRVPFFDTPAWIPEAPHLVPVTVELLDSAHSVLDRREFQFGFRTVAMRDGKVHLNGQPYPLKGVCYVYDSPVTGLVMTPEQIATDLRLMKAVGCNAVRCHYPMDEAFYAACDRLGLLVWIEPPVYCYHPGDDEIGTRFADPEWLALAQAMAREMIAVARNHPSVAIYSIGNECNTANPEAEAFFRQLAAAIRAADPTRLISYAALYGIVGPIADIVDVLGINSYWGWYDKIWGGKGLAPADSEPCSVGSVQCSVAKEPIDLAPMRKMLDAVLAMKCNLALLLTEFGADSVTGSYSASRDMWSENYHADLLREILALVEDYPQIVGTFPFCFSDYRDPSKVHNGYWNELNLKGLVDYRRNRKLAFGAVCEAYRPAVPGAPGECIDALEGFESLD
jgi:beta-glucuronidase